MMVTVMMTAQGGPWIFKIAKEMVTEDKKRRGERKEMSKMKQSEGSFVAKGGDWGGI